MALNYGKKWEEHFYKEWKRNFPNTLIQRLYDQVTKYKDVSKNPSDYYSFLDGKLIYQECKVTESNTLHFDKFPQLERLLEKAQYENVLGYVIIWFKNNNVVVMLSAEDAQKIKDDGNKSINVKFFIDEKYNKLYNYILIPTRILRDYPSCDFASVKNQILGTKTKIRLYE